MLLLMLALSDPSASGGIDLDSNLIVELATECPNLAGVKLTYGSVSPRSILKAEIILDVATLES